MLSMEARTAYSAEHRMFRDQVRKFLDRHIAPHADRWEEAGIVDRQAWTLAGEAGLLCPTVPEEYGGLGLDFGYNATIDEEVGYQGHNAGLQPAVGHRGRLLGCIWVRGAETALAASHGVGRDRDGDRHDGAGCRLRPSGHQDDRAAGRQPLCGEGQQDLHHEWADRRPDHRRCQDGSRARRQGHQPDSGGSRSRRVCARPQPGQNRSKQRRHVRIVFRRCACAHHELSGIGKPGIHLPDEPVAAGAP